MGLVYFLLVKRALVSLQRVRTQQEGGHLQTIRGTSPKTKRCWYPDLGLPGLQNRDKLMSVVEATQSVLFHYD